MSILAQGTQVFMVRNGKVTRIPGATAFNPAGNPRDQLDDTPLEETQSRRYKKGLGTPGAASLTVNADPSEPAHVELHDMANDGSEERVDWYVGWSDGPVDAEGKPTAFPEVSGGTVTLPTTRTWYSFNGYVSDFPMDFSANALVSSQVSIQRSGSGKWTPKKPAAGSGE
ncbi:phage tail tube protein [Salinicola aestuarinus]|uniref:phage tail tube protein n=1 Tax=Salinicola aestuarinus TaxID=1949082 RepID=UPI000DA201B1|nr:phage tail tube protein [Salinicola aestuarinus]